MRCDHALTPEALRRARADSPQSSKVCQECQALLSLQGHESEKSSAPGQPSYELETLLKQKQVAEAECCRLHKDMSELTASLQNLTKEHITTQEELSLVREHLSVQTAETQAALQNVQSLTAEAASARDQALQLQLVLDEATKRVQAECALGESARTQQEEVAAAVHALKQQRSELQGQLASLQVCQYVTLAFIAHQCPWSWNLLTELCEVRLNTCRCDCAFSPALLIAIHCVIAERSGPQRYRALCTARPICFGVGPGICSSERGQPSIVVIHATLKMISRMVNVYILKDQLC